MENKDIETLLAKEAIRDQIYTYCRALDRIDNELGYSVFAEDSKVNYGPTFPKGNGRQFIDNMLNQHRHMISTHHMMTNILIKVDGNKAASETYMYAACKFPKKLKGGKKSTFTVEARCRDIDKWECRDGKWLIVERVVAGDNTMIVVPGQDLENYNTERNNKKDPSYKFFADFE